MKHTLHADKHARKLRLRVPLCVALTVDSLAPLSLCVCLPSLPAVQLGPLGKVMSMIPGMSNLIGPGKEKESVARIKRFLTIMDSFTQEELDSTMSIFEKTPNRLVRIARGAGVQLRHVHEVLETYKPFKKVRHTPRILRACILSSIACRTSVLSGLCAVCCSCSVLARVRVRFAQTRLHQRWVVWPR